MTKALMSSNKLLAIVAKLMDTVTTAEQLWQLYHPTAL